MNTDHKEYGHEEYQYPDTEMIPDDHHDSKEDLGFMNPSKNETPTKGNETNHNISNTNKEEGITQDTKYTKDRSTEAPTTQMRHQ